MKTKIFWAQSPDGQVWEVVAKNVREAASQMLVNPKDVVLDEHATEAHQAGNYNPSRLSKLEKS